jgi:predicted dehydrogenase
MTRPFRTALVGVGRIGASYADDPLTARHYRYASHAQVLAEHPSFDWEVVVDSDPEKLALARERWGIAHAASTIAGLLRSCDPEVLVLATPPASRREFVVSCPNLKAVLCEKPLGTTLEETRKFLDLCASRRILVQVNLWRRCDELFRQLAEGQLANLIGCPQAVHGIYGNGLANNGTHLVDACRMLFGKVVAARALGTSRTSDAFPLTGDIDVACSIAFDGGLHAVLQPLDFHHYREVGLDIWGESGRLELLNEGLTIRLSRSASHRALTGADELAIDAPDYLNPTVGDALFRVYNNLASALCSNDTLQSSGASAWRSECVIDAIRQSVASGDGRSIPLAAD